MKKYTIKEIYNVYDKFREKREREYILAGKKIYNGTDSMKLVNELNIVLRFISELDNK